MITLKPPFIITPHLSPGLRIGSAVLTLMGIEYGERDVADFRLDFDNGYTYYDKTLRSGAQGFRNNVEPFCGWLSFLSAAAESRSYSQRIGRPSDSEGLFPHWVAEWAVDNSGEIERLLIEIERGGASLIVDPEFDSTERKAP